MQDVTTSKAGVQSKEVQTIVSEIVEKLKKEYNPLKIIYLALMFMAIQQKIAI